MNVDYGRTTSVQLLARASLSPYCMTAGPTPCGSSVRPGCAMSTTAGRHPAPSCTTPSGCDHWCSTTPQRPLRSSPASAAGTPSTRLASWQGSGGDRRRRRRRRLPRLDRRNVTDGPAQLVPQPVRVAGIDGLNRETLRGSPTWPNAARKRPSSTRDSLVVRYPPPRGGGVVFFKLTFELLPGAPARSTARWKSRVPKRRMPRSRRKPRARCRPDVPRQRPGRGRGSAYSPGPCREMDRKIRLLVERREPPLIDPPIKPASRRSMARAVRMRRATIHCEKPGASCSIR